MVSSPVGRERVVAPVEFAFDVTSTAVSVALPGMLWTGLFLLAWGHGPFAESIGLGRKAFWLLVPGALFASFAFLPITPVSVRLARGQPRRGGLPPLRRRPRAGSLRPAPRPVAGHFPRGAGSDERHPLRDRPAVDRGRPCPGRVGGSTVGRRGGDPVGRGGRRRVLRGRGGHRPSVAGPVRPRRRLPLRRRFGRPCDDVRRIERDPRSRDHRVVPVPTCSHRWPRA